MEKEKAFNFLVKTTIPIATPTKEYKNKLNLDGENRLWDAVWRAHRDVLTGRAYLSNYTKKNYGVNEVVCKLYDLILKSEVSLNSKMLIDELTNSFDVEFGAIQKLVNMTLKYIIILNAFDKKFHIDVDESKCDCPIDSIILGKLGLGQKYKWTAMERGEYKDIQEDISKKLEQTEHKKCENIMYDFINW